MGFKTADIRMTKTIKAIFAAAAAAVSLALCAPAALAAPYMWDGGHDAFGWSEPTTSALFAEGTTRLGFEEYLIVRNPGTEECALTIRYLFPAPADSKKQAIDLGPGEVTSVFVNDVVGPGKDVSIALEAEPGVVAERQMYFNYKGVWTGGHVSRGVPEPLKRWYFAEGTSREGFDEWLCLQNPEGREVTADLTFMLGDGRNVEKSVKLGANSRETVDINAAVGKDQDVSIRLDASMPVVAERSMYFDYKSAWRGGHTMAGTSELSREWLFAEGTTRSGFEEWLSIMNPGADTSARVEYLFPDGGVAVREYGLKGRSRTTVFVNQDVGPERDVSVRVRSGTPIACERPMYFLYHGAWEGGHVVPGTAAGAKTWYFPTASVGQTFDSYLCLMNPGPEKNYVTVETLGDGNKRQKNGLQMEPHSRFTMNLNAAAEGISWPWVSVTGSEELIAERPTYFAYEPKADEEPFDFAEWNGIRLKCPIRYRDLLGPIFHQASPELSDGTPANVQVLQPVGICLKDSNPGGRHPSVVYRKGSDPYYFIEESRGRGTYSTTACDVQAKKGATVLAPVDGVVLAAEPYLLYGSYPDLRVKILIDGHPGYQVAVLHMDSLLVTRGQRVKAGVTEIGTVRDLVPYFNSGPNDFTREEGNHPHVQINYRPQEQL